MRRWPRSPACPKRGATARCPRPSPRKGCSNGADGARPRNGSSALARGGPGLNEVRDRLDQLYRMQARFEDAARLLRDGCAVGARPRPRAPRPLGDGTGNPAVRDHPAGPRHRRTARPDGGTGLARAGASRHSDGAARRGRGLAEAMREPTAGRTGLACLARLGPRGRPARRGPRRPASDRLGNGSAPVDRLAWRAWLAQRGDDAAAERRALEAWLTLEPRNPLVLNRLAALGDRGRRRRPRGRPAAAKGRGRPRPRRL